MVAEVVKQMKTTLTITRSSRPQMFFKIDALKIFVKLAAKHLWRDFFL